MDQDVKILLISTGDTNGAYEALYRMAKHFDGEGYHVKMLVKQKSKKDDFIVPYLRKLSIIARIYNRLNRLLLKKNLHKNKSEHFHKDYYFFSTNEFNKNISVKNVLDIIGFIPNYVFVGMTDNFMNSTDILEIQQVTKAQVFNIAVDMNHFTGGCHYAWDCNGYITGCDLNCPAIIHPKIRSIAKRNFQKKNENSKKGNFQIIGMSEWTVRQAKNSLIYKNQELVININSLIDTNVFNARSRGHAKSIFNLNADKFYILLGSQDISDKRKGFHYAIKALNLLYERLKPDQRVKIEIIVVSRNSIGKLDLIKFKKIFIDYINDYRLLSLLYQASDVFVNSSIEDSGPMMVSEALASGTPVVGFDMGVVNNMVLNDFNGFKAAVGDITELASGIEKIFKLSKSEYNNYSRNAVNQVINFSSIHLLSKVFNFNKSRN
jgi:glycosyltransferase involved in cell wall biosynthesis